MKTGIHRGIVAVLFGLFLTNAFGEGKEEFRTLWDVSAPREDVYWRGGSGVSKQPAKIGEPVIVESGMVAACTFDATASNWSGFRALRIDFDCQEDGLIPFLFRERDPEGIECWVAPIQVSSASRDLSIRLAPEPEGDLRPALPQQDGIFNPEGLGPMDVTFMSTVGRLRIWGVGLERE